ncbi:MAG: sigma-70 family RNA polymerase sigma factor [Bacteroidota bacterium]
MMLNSLSDHNDLKSLLKACRKGKPEAQERLYRQFFGYAMGICLRYARTREEAQEIVNDGFMKIFTQLDKFQQHGAFKGWLRRIMINASIDHFRKHQKHYNGQDIAQIYDLTIPSEGVGRLGEQELIRLVQKLPPSYRVTFNLYVMEGYKHHEIAKQLGISEGTSKSNLAKARQKLRAMLRKVDPDKAEAYG